MTFLTLRITFDMIAVGAEQQPQQRKRTIIKGTQLPEVLSCHYATSTDADRR